MNKLITALLCIVTLCAKAQTPQMPQTQAFGKIDKADLEMKVCDFEKDANAEVLFDKGYVWLDANKNLVFEHHIRIKIFNDKGKDEANIKLRYYGVDRSEVLTSLVAQTINLNNGNIEITKVDKKLIYSKPLDKHRSETAFSFPNIQPGSVIEYKYELTSEYIGNFPDWYFQNDIPTRYSEISSDLPSSIHYKNMVMVVRPFVKNTNESKSIANIPSLRSEPYMTSKKDNSDRILYELSGVDGYYQNFSNTWKELGEKEIGLYDFGGQFKRKLSGEDVILTMAKTLKTDDEKIAYIFNEVKNTVKWNEENTRYTNDGTVEAWSKKIGNSTEINLILYHLLQKAGLKAYPMLVSTRANGRVNPSYPSRYQFNKTIAYIPVDSTFNYVLDATNKYNHYKEIPNDLLNSFGFYMDKETEVYKLTALQKSQAVRQVVLITADIKPGGTMTGKAQLNSFSYNRMSAVERFKTDGEKKYIDYLRDDDNNLKISSIKFENLDIDTLPLLQNIDFNLELAGSDENYIYINPNLFTSLHNNPFISETRTTDVDFGYNSVFQINGNYNLPAGYKIDALPKSISITMPDNSVTFRRIVLVQDGKLIVSYTMSNKKSLYFKEDYPDFHAFYKKMHEMLNEQIVLKKS